MRKGVISTIDEAIVNVHRYDTCHYHKNGRCVIDTVSFFLMEHSGIMIL